MAEPATVSIAGSHEFSGCADTATAHDGYRGLGLGGDSPAACFELVDELTAVRIAFD
jgi:hypothetical protein